MANLPISLLPEITGLTSDSDFVVSKSGTTYKVSFEEVNNTITGFTTGGTYSTDTITFTKDNGATFTVTGITDTYITGGTYSAQTGELYLYNNDNSNVRITGLTNNIPVTAITESTPLTWDYQYWGISASTNPTNITLPTTINKDGYVIIIKDEAYNCTANNILISTVDGLIDYNPTYNMNTTDGMSLKLIVRNGNWFII